jgi:two-component system, NtrC family, response regulator AtoC
LVEPISHEEPRVLGSPPLPNVDEILARVAQSRVTVLITGETGVGKDKLAIRIHESSPRAGKPFVAVNCAAISETLIDSELFGHERGAFTGADKAKLGLFEAADGGTIFLDEVGELSASAQTKLLRVLEARCIHRVGGVSQRAVDVRVIAATNADLADHIAAGRFRSDLFYRLEGIRLHLPPLRERPWEILPAARQFLTDQAREEGIRSPMLSEATERALCAHAWEGNFRELRNVMERAAVLCTGAVIQPEDLELPVTISSFPTAPLGGSERDRIIAALAACGGNQTRAAHLLGMARRTLIARLDTYGIARPQKEAPAGR